MIFGTPNFGDDAAPAPQQSQPSPSDPSQYFQRPSGADPNFDPRNLETGYKSHLNPFWRAMPATMAIRMWQPSLPPGMGPGTKPLTPITAPSATQSVVPGPTPSVLAPGAPGATPSASAPVNGLGRYRTFEGAFGSAMGAGGGGSHPMHQHTGGFAARSPYRTMKAGFYPRTRQTQWGMRAGVNQTGALIRRQMNPAYAYDPVGNYRALTPMQAAQVPQVQATSNTPHAHAAAHAHAKAHAAATGVPTAVVPAPTAAVPTPGMHGGWY